MEDFIFGGRDNFRSEALPVAAVSAAGSAWAAELRRPKSRLFPRLLRAATSGFPDLKLLPQPDREIRNPKIGSVRGHFLNSYLSLS